MLLPTVEPRPISEDLPIFRLLNCQLRYVWNNATILGVEKGRQLGFTWVSAARILRRIFTSPVAQDHYWISRDEFTAKMFLQDVLTWLDWYNRFKNHGREFKHSVIDMSGVQTMKITFDCGSNIFVMSSSVNAIAGKRGHIYIDEAALHKDFQQLFDIAKPATRWGFTLTFFSTHRSKQNYFYKLIEKIKKGEIPEAEVMSITLADALNDGYLHTLNYKNMLVNKKQYTSNEEFFEEEKAQASSEEMFLQENMCIPADAEQTQAVREDDLARVMVPSMDLFTGAQPGKRYFAGIDIGRNRDLTVIWICEDVSTNKEPLLVTRFIETMSQTEFSKQEKRIVEVLKLWKPKHCIIDGTNVGANIAENLEKRFGFCEMFKFTAKTRPKSISDLCAFIRRDPVALKVPNSNEVWEDFLSVQRYINKYGQEDFFIPTHTGSSNSHGDRFMAMVLCLQAFMSKRSLARYTIEREEGKKVESRRMSRSSSRISKFRY
ncbi:terminase family protein [Candidatus Pacearchaeota archaeon]|nr:terminase family protein [Candidatus Pacearchaeota archaeon]